MSVAYYRGKAGNYGLIFEVGCANGVSLVSVSIAIGLVAKKLVVVVVVYR